MHSAENAMLIKNSGPIRESWIKIDLSQAEGSIISGRLQLTCRTGIQYIDPDASNYMVAEELCLYAPDDSWTEDLLDYGAALSSQIRKTCAEKNLALILYTQSENAVHELMSGFDYTKGADTELLLLMQKLASESGYSEIANAPMITMGHSYAAGYAWLPAAWNEDRIIAELPTKMGVSRCDLNGISAHYVNVPIFYLVGEYYEWDVASMYRRADDYITWALGKRSENSKADHLIGAAVEWGGGHFEWTDDCAELISAFIKKAVDKRTYPLPALNGAINLKPITEDDGVLLKSYTSSAGPETPIPAKDASEETKKQSFWYIDEEFANMAKDFTQNNLGKRQMVAFTDKNGEVQEFRSGTGTQQIQVEFEEDGSSFKVYGKYLSEIPEILANSNALQIEGNSGADIKFGVTSGPVVQINENTFQYRPDAISYNIDQGNSVWMQVYSEANNGYGYAMLPDQWIFRIQETAEWNKLFLLRSQKMFLKTPET